ncbi:MAG: biotin carboxylase N-terminal domain-containing protein [Mycobacterium sp.]|uniref:acetyl/propionyl/methylcrotonyl-CoA carboxylase subunit alpha n=1 Tax=Mycobacterium sp. TaxID=1785 RepID=UPI0026116436|nr:biotin carboxylase N-terminal domain-containing protein [Mycobacterium sp.]MDI3314927.1 biotin carboxylase N-terminal domain-containing protein [Mycobacterium sp.]
MITRVLVANRGEIARRVFATCRRLGLGTVAVYTDPDAGAPHVAEADARVRLPKTTDYLNAGAIIAAARAAGADAVHPGYGFLSENADFAAAVQDAGLTWVGPPASAVRAMGSKIESKKMMAAAGVPVLGDLDPDTVTSEQLPVIVKAAAGGGGRGMRVVHELSFLPAEVEAARREAGSTFGDPTVFCERYVAAGRHIEVQVLADLHGTVWAVGERECSIQRRHQKIIEESPSPLVERTPGMRAKLFDAARLAAAAIGYTGAGTVEFLADPSSEEGELYFLEMNTRLQVEHPVTEETTGLDLVELQLAIADGARLAAEPPAALGHSIEARLYAEDPAHGWQPQPGLVRTIDVPGVRACFETLGRRAGIRLDSGVVDGCTVPIHYDPMLAKVISYAPTRRQSAMVLADALARSRLHGIRTNRDLLVNVLRHPAFLDGATDTAFFDTHDLTRLSAPLADAGTVRLSAIAAALADAAHNRAGAPVLGSIPSGWRNLASGYQVKTYREDGGRQQRVEYRFSGNAVMLPGDEAVQLVSLAADAVVLADADGVARRFAVARYGDDIYVDSPNGSVHLVALPRFSEPGSAPERGSLVAPIPGSVTRVGARLGEHVTAGQPLVWLEAMKMEHTITAPADGVLVQLNVTPGAQVEAGIVLARVEAPTAEGDPS